MGPRIAVNLVELVGWVALGVLFFLFYRTAADTQEKALEDPSLRRKVRFYAHLSEGLGAVLFLGGVYFLHYYPNYHQGFMILGVMGCYSLFWGIASIKALPH